MVTATHSRAAGRAGRPSKADAEAVEGRLLDAAEFLFLEHGFDGASVAAVAALAGASKQTIYQRYPTKARLFEAVIQRAIERFLGGLDRKIVGRTVQTRLVDLATKFVERTLEPQSLRLMRALIAEVTRLGDLARLLDRDANGRIEQFIIDSGELDLIVDPARGPAHQAVAARHLIDLTVNPLVLRALLGADVEALRREAKRTVSTSVAFFVRGFGS